MSGEMQFNPIGLVVDALEVAGLPKPDAAAVLEKLAAKQDSLAAAVARSAVGGAVVAGQAFVDAVKADAAMLRQAAGGLRATARREAEEAAAANDTSKPAPGTVLAEVKGP